MAAVLLHSYGLETAFVQNDFTPILAVKIETTLLKPKNGS